MSLLRYLKPINGLPDPRGLLSTTMSREAIAAANQEVQKLGAKCHQKTWPILEVFSSTTFCYRRYSSAWSSCHYVITPHTRLFLKLLHFIFFTRASLTALWCVLISRMYNRVRVCTRVCAIWLYQIFFDLYQFSSLGSGDEN